VLKILLSLDHLPFKLGTERLALTCQLVLEIPQRPALVAELPEAWRDAPIIECHADEVRKTIADLLALLTHGIPSLSFQFLRRDQASPPQNLTVVLRVKIELHAPSGAPQPTAYRQRENATWNDNKKHGGDGVKVNPRGRGIAFRREKPGDIFGAGKGTSQYQGCGSQKRAEDRSHHCRVLHEGTLPDDVKSEEKSPHIHTEDGADCYADCRKV
jgi:hypothetical protein